MTITNRNVTISNITNSSLEILGGLVIMDIIILGLLMIKGTTIYELQKKISEQLTFSISSSMGSIQAAIKKLLNKEMITYVERTENNVNKKVYFITEIGKKYFIEQISTPMENKATNKELSKFFFMGFVKSELREGFIDSYLKELEAELAILEKLKTQIGLQREIDEDVLSYLKAHEDVSEDLTVEAVKEVSIFNLGTLDYGLDSLKFEIEWFTKFKEKMKMEREGNESGE